jgi:tetratricopeptide (TPR) repeat protein
LAAVEVTRGAVKIMNPTEEPRLFVFAHLNIAFFFHEAGRHAEAMEALTEASEQARSFPDAYTQVRITWLEGKLAAALGDLDRAEKTFLEVRENLIARRQRYDAAMVSLDLALLYLRQNRTADLMTIAEEMHALFTAEEVLREALAALLVFQEAARKEQLTAEAVQKFLAVLKRLRT